MKRLNNKEVKNLRTIIKAEDLPENAAYYTFTATEIGRDGISYYIIFDKDFNDIEAVLVRYTDALKGLIQVSDESDNVAHIPAKMVYKLTKSSKEGFWICNKIAY